MVTVGLFGIAGLLLVPIVNYAIKLANRYPKIFEWIFIIVCAFGVLFIEDRNTSFVILCLFFNFYSCHRTFYEFCLRLGTSFST